MSFFFLLLVAGLFTGMVYALVALGFVLIYKASGAINFAQGEFVMFGGFLTAACLQLYHINLVISIIIGLGFMVILGVIVERTVLRPLIGRDVIYIIIAPIGLASILIGSLLLILGGKTLNLPLPIRDAPYVVGSLLIKPIHLVGAIISLVFIGAFSLLFLKSRTGIALRAVADDTPTAQAMGINVRRFFALVWALAGVVAGIGGILWGNMIGADVQTSLIGLKVFPVIILGGLTSIPGAVVGGLIIGVAENIAAGYLDYYVGGGTKNMVPFVIMIIFLMFRPHGIFGEEIIERV
jgi:branched-chain amino acid transport system permease protein